MMNSQMHLETIAIESSSASWEFWFGLLEMFHQNEGHSNVTYNYEINNFRLGAWV